MSFVYRTRPRVPFPRASATPARNLHEAGGDARGTPRVPHASSRAFRRASATPARNLHEAGGDARGTPRVPHAPRVPSVARAQHPRESAEVGGDARGTPRVPHASSRAFRRASATPARNLHEAGGDARGTPRVPHGSSRAFRRASATPARICRGGRGRPRYTACTARVLACLFVARAQHRAKSAEAGGDARGTRWRRQRGSMVWPVTSDVSSAT